MKTCKTSYPLWAMSCDGGLPSSCADRCQNPVGKIHGIHTSSLCSKALCTLLPWARCRMLNWPYNFWWPYPLRTVGRVLGDTRHFAVEAIGGYPAAREMSNSNDFPGGTQSPVSAPHFFWSSVISPPAGFTNFTETSVGSSSTRVTSRLDLGDIQTFWSTQIAVVYEFL